MYEAEKTAGAESLVRLVNANGEPPDLIVQAGIGYGCVEIPVLRKAWPDAKWIGFEPNPESAHEAAKTYPGIISRAALSYRPGIGMLDVPAIANRGSLLTDGGVTQLIVTTVRLDTIVRHTPQPGRILLWLDCEGSELAVLRGAEGIIEQVIAVNVELWDKPPVAGWPKREAIDAWLMEHGFHMAGSQRLWPEFGIEDAVYLRS